MSGRLASLAVVAVVAIAACSAPASPAPTSASPSGGSPATPTELVLMTHDSFALSDESIASFEATNGATLRVLRSGDAGTMVNQAILSRDHPLGDVMYGVDNTFLSRALDADLFEPYEPQALANVPAAFQLDARKRVTPIDYGDVCLNVDVEAFAGGTPPAPATLDDLIRPEYRGMLVVENPATSSPGLAFLLATIVRYGDDPAEGTTWRDYWAALRDNDVLVSDGWEDAYYGRFSGGAGEGDRPIVVSYASSPAAEVAFAEPPPAQAPTAVVDDGCFRQVEFAAVLQGTEVGSLARAFIDHLLSRPVQDEIPLQMFVYPARADAQLPPVFVEHAQAPSDPLEMAYPVIGSGRERWVAEWTDIVLR